MSFITFNLNKFHFSRFKSKCAAVILCSFISMHIIYIVLNKVTDVLEVLFVLLMLERNDNKI